jgi:hypothetical protein
MVPLRLERKRRKRKSMAIPHLLARMRKIRHQKARRQSQNRDQRLQLAVMTLKGRKGDIRRRVRSGKES